MLSRLAGGKRALWDIPNPLEAEDVCIAEWRVTEFGQTERLPSVSCSATEATEALAQPSSRPRRVPGGLVAGDWEQSPLGPGLCAGTAREGEAPAEALSRWDSACPGALPGP